MILIPLRNLADAAWRPASRFPLVLACGTVAAVGGCLAVAEPWLIRGPDPDPWIRLMAAASLGIPLYIAATLISERRAVGNASATGGLPAGRGTAKRSFWAAQALLLAVPVLFYLYWPQWTDEVTPLRYAHLFLLLHLALVVGPWLGKSRNTAFWHFNWRLLLRFVLGGVYAGALFAGLAAALAGLDNLFGVDIPDETYPQLFFVLRKGDRPRSRAAIRLGSASSRSTC